MKTKSAKNRLGTVSLLVAAAGFLLINFVPWPLIGALWLVPGLSLRGLIAAFFDASLVGAFADWFAVTALFRYPMGIKLPHTNVIARNKDSVADAVPRFLTGFVSGESITRELAAIDFAAMLEKVLQEGGQREDLHRFLRERLAKVARADSTRDEVANLVKGLLDLVTKEVDLPEAGAAVVTWARSSRFTEKIIEGVAGLVQTEMGRHREELVVYLTQKLKRSAGWQAIFIGQGTSEKIVAAIDAELEGLRVDPKNELRGFLFTALDAWAVRLRKPGSDRDQFRLLVLGAIANQGFAAQLTAFAQDLVARMGDDLGREDSQFVGSLERIEDLVLARIQAEPEFRSAFNRGLVDLLADLVARSRLVETMSAYLSAQMKRTDTATFVRQVESAVWNDLQYIRVNGAVVGGIAGLVLAFLQNLVRW